ncbi:ArsR/SmtB family transcription factor [Catelliglobosispora koreensis]|uniref:ArsR/SmtB family transcription factor n=1 Tax=Catelliglobosispora koreensis TaxID=129052 RepID=UPI0003620FC2|nr:DUF5937 family protein [Catelliglobosispora koreensis]
MLTLRMTASAVARTRLALSPAAEITVWLWLLAMGRSHPLFGAHSPAARAALRHPDVALVASSLSPAYAPDLLTPAPLPGLVSSVLDTDMISSTTQEAIAEQIERVGHYRRQVPATVREAVDAGVFGRRAANGLRTFWRHALADGWSSLHDSMEADLLARMHTMASQGLAGMLETLHPAISWTGDSLLIELGRHEEDVTLGDRELVLSPTVLSWPKVTAKICGQGPAVINYPAASLAPNAGRNPHVLARLYGDTRASLLADLDRARSTAELSARHDVAPSTVSYHLRVLHQAGLITRRRAGHYMLYQRKPS